MKFSILKKILSLFSKADRFSPKEKSARNTAGLKLIDYIEKEKKIKSNITPGTFLEIVNSIIRNSEKTHSIEEMKLGEPQEFLNYFLYFYLSQPATKYLYPAVAEIVEKDFTQIAEKDPNKEQHTDNLINGQKKDSNKTKFIESKKND